MNIPFQWKQWLGILLTLVVVLLTTILGGAFVLSVEGLSIFWPPNAILLSALLIIERKFSWLCVALCFPMYVIAELWSGYSTHNAVLFSLANCIEVASAFFLLTIYLHTPYTFSSFHKILVFTFTVALASILGGVIGTYSVYLLGGPYLPTLIKWVLGDVIAFLIFTPLILSMREWPAWLRDVSLNRILEASSVLGFLLLIMVISYGAWGLEALRFVGIQVVAIGLVFYSAIKFGVKGVSLSALLFSLIIVSQQLKGLGAFADLTGKSSIIWMQVYVLVVIFSAASLAILIAERDTAFASLEQMNINLESLVTERSNELLRSTKQLAEAQKMEAIGKVTGGVAHDFNNLLAVIQGNTDLIELDDREGKHDISISSILGAVESGSSLTHSLLAYSSKAILSPQPTNIGELITSRLDVFQRLIGETVILTHEIDEGLWPVLIDPNRYEDVLLNLVINARDAMPGGGQLHIKAENIDVEDLADELINELKAGSLVLITVTDSGCGIRPDLLNKVMDPFFTTKEVGEGSGLGLSISYGFAKQSQGHLVIESAQGESTSVKIYLPRADKAVRKTHNLNTVGKHSHRETCRILVVEDDPALMKVCRRLLRAHGFTVASAMNGREALIILVERGPFDILLTDVILPGDLSGFDIQREANLLQPGIGSILTTGYPDLVGIDDPQLIENADILYKPYVGYDLLDRIDLALKSKTV